MRIRHWLAGIGVVALASLGVAGPASAVEEGGEEPDISHASEECIHILEGGGEIDDCQEAPSPILPETNEEDARNAAERIIEAFRDHAFQGEQRGPVPIGASIGVATYPADGRTATDLIAAADRALYRVKRDGGHDAAGAEGDAA